MSIHFFHLALQNAASSLRRYSTLFFTASCSIYSISFPLFTFLLSLLAVDPKVKYRLRQETGLHWFFFFIIIVQTALVKITSDYSSLKEYHSNYGIIFKELYLDLTDTSHGFEIRGTISMFLIGKMCKWGMLDGKNGGKYLPVESANYGRYGCIIRENSKWLFVFFFQGRAKEPHNFGQIRVHIEYDFWQKLVIFFCYTCYHKIIWRFKLQTPKYRDLEDCFKLCLLIG